MQCHPRTIPGSFKYAMEGAEQAIDTTVVALAWEASIKRLVGTTSEKEKQHVLEGMIERLSNEMGQELGRGVAIDCQVDRCLCEQVMRYIPPYSQDALDTLVLLLKSLELTWSGQSSTQRRRDSRVRGLEIVPHLLTLWKLPDISVATYTAVLSLLRSWTKMQDDTVKSLLIKAGLVQAISLPFERKSDSDAELWPRCLSLVKDLIFRGKPAEKEMLYEKWLPHVLFALPLRPCYESAVACLWNWAVDDKLALRMAANSLLWATFTRCDPKLQSIGAQRNTLSAVGSILSVGVLHLDESPFDQGQGKWVLDLLFETLRDSEDNDLRRRAFRTIRCLSMSQWGRILLQYHFGNDQKLVLYLAKMFADYREQDDTRVQVSLAIQNFLPHLQDSWAQIGPQLELSIVNVLVDARTSSKIAKHSIDVLTTCFEFSPWKRGPSCLSDAFFGRLHCLVKENIKDEKLHESVIALLYLLLSKGDNATIASVFENPKAVDTVAVLLSDFPETTAKAVQCIQIAVQASETKKHFVGHDLLLTNLVNVCLMSSGNRKADAKSVLVSLVSDL